MRPEELAALHAGAVAPDRGWTAAEFAGLLAAPGALLVAEPAAFVLGRVTLDEAEILMVATDPDLRRQGLARRTLARFEAAAAARGALRALLDVAEDNAPARALYAGAGYVEDGRRRGYYARPDGPAVDAVLMSKALPSG